MRASRRLRALGADYPAGVPQRRALQYDALSIDPATAQMLNRTGVRRDGTGIPRFDGNPELHPYLARGLGDEHGVYHEMARGDGAVAGTLALVFREVLRAHYRVTIEDDATPMERDAHDLVERVLGLGAWRRTGGFLRGGFRTLLGHALQAPVYGFSPCELTWGTVWWRGAMRLVPTAAHWRAPWSVDRWIWRGDELVGMGQLVQSGGGGIHLGGVRRTIPIESLLLWTHRYVDGNPEGTSMLRAAWLPWRAKTDTVLRHQVAQDKLFGGVAILSEGGTPEMGPYPWCTAQDTDGFFEAFDLWKDAALDWLKKPYGWDVDIEHPEFEIPSPIAELRWYDHQIFLTGLAPLLGLDAAGAASRGLSDGLAAVLYNALDGLARELCETINGLQGMPWTGLIRRICDANFATTEEFRYPTVEPFGLSSPDLAGFVDAVTKAYQFRLATPVIDDQLEFRRMAGLPEVSREKLEALDKLLRGDTGTQVSQRDTQAPVEPPSEGEGAGGSSAPEGSDVDAKSSTATDPVVAALLADPDPAVRQRAADVWLQHQRETRAAQ